MSFPSCKQPGWAASEICHGEWEEEEGEPASAYSVPGPCLLCIPSRGSPGLNRIGGSGCLSRWGNGHWGALNSCLPMRWCGGWACRMPFLLGLRQVTGFGAVGAARSGGGCGWLLLFLFPHRQGNDFPKRNCTNSPSPPVAFDRGVWWCETLFISSERAQLRARHRNSAVVVALAAGWLFVSCSSAGFIWLGFRVLSTVLNVELCLHYLKTCQTWNPLLVQAIFWSLNCVLLFFKDTFMYIISDKGHQTENGNVPWLPVW